MTKQKGHKVEDLNSISNAIIFLIEIYKHRF